MATPASDVPSSTPAAAGAASDATEEYQIIQEGRARITFPKANEVFYNKVQVGDGRRIWARDGYAAPSPVLARPASACRHSR